MRASRGARLVDPTVLARIDDLELIARGVVDGVTNGLHASPHLGRSVDFAEHRAYTPGDDIRLIDWRAFARTDRLYVKEFEADSNANFLLLLDVSRSMDYGSSGITKLHYGRCLAACLAYLAGQQRDRVGLITFSDRVVDYVPPAAKHRDVVLHTLERVTAAGGGGLTEPMIAAADACRRRGVAVLISDLYEDPEVALEALRRLGHRAGNVIVFHLLDPAERSFPFDGAATYEDLEGSAALPVVASEVREQYRSLIEEHIATLTRRFGEHGIDYLLAETNAPLDGVLVRYLTRRQRLNRVRRRWVSSS